VTRVGFRVDEELGRMRDEATSVLEAAWAAVDLAEETSVMRVELG
jgi:hypothetical protein